MAKMVFKNGKVSYEYDETDENEKVLKDEVQKKMDAKSQLEQKTTTLVAKDFKNLSTEEKDELLYLLLKMHNIL